MYRSLFSFCKKKVSDLFSISSSNNVGNSNTMTTVKNNNNLPLGLRNNNPLNIRASSNAWQGKVGSNKGFEVFSTIEYGIRAGVKNLLTYYDKYHLTDIKSIISRWAPASENNTASYISTVSKLTGISSNAKLPRSKEVLASLFSAMSSVELGSSYKIPSSKVLSVIALYNLL